MVSTISGELHPSLEDLADTFDIGYIQVYRVEIVKERIFLRKLVDRPSRSGSSLRHPVLQPFGYKKERVITVGLSGRFCG